MEIILDGRQMVTQEEAMAHLIERLQLEGDYKDFEDIWQTLVGLSDIDRKVILTYPETMEAGLGPDLTMEIIRTFNQLDTIYDNQNFQVIPETGE